MNSWPISFDEIEEHFITVQEALGLKSVIDTNDLIIKNSKYSALMKLEPDFNLRLSSWIPFKKRNFSKAFNHILNETIGVSVWINSPVVSISRSTKSGKPIVSKLIAHSSNGKVLEVEPSIVIICAGALESTRILLEFDESTDKSITKNGAPLGCFFSDHLSATCGEFKCTDIKEFNLRVAPIFQGGIMRTPRLELSEKLQKELRLTSAFAHFTFITDGTTGFDYVRSILRRKQGERNVLSGLSISNLWKLIKDILLIGYWRYVHRRLWFPLNSKLLLQVDIEQNPNRESRLTLTSNLDKLNRKRLNIDWKITQDDARVVEKVAELVCNLWNQSGMNKIASLELSSPSNLKSFESLYDVFHPTGTIRMGSLKSDSVVDRNLRLWETENCYVSTTAVFPTAGSANPGMTHLALTARLSSHIVDLLKKKN